MLIEYSVKNYKSIKGRQTLSLVAKKNSEHAFSTDHKKAPYLLKRIAILGPNASGKSNIILSMRTALDIIKTSYKYENDAEFPIKAYLLDDITAQLPSEFEFVFLHENTIYQYGFAADKYQIYEEWLYATPSHGKLQRWIRRGSYDEKASWYINPLLKGRRKEWIEEARPNTLLLSLIGTYKNHDLIKNILNSLVRGVWCDLSSEFPDIFTAAVCVEEEHIKKEVVEFLKRADLGIADIKINKEQLSIKFPKDMPDSVKEDISNRLQEKHTFNTYTMHSKENGGNIRFEMEEESEGTKLLYAWACPILGALNRGITLVIDEINNSMHFKELEFIENLFLNPKTNPKGAQLIFTTHDISVLHRLHREEIYFTDKERGFHTQLYPLTDFENRGDTSAYKRYTQGLYFALPKIVNEQ